MEWNRVWAVGYDSYVRVYPNPGVGICVGPVRLAISWRGGIEMFERHPQHVWRRTRAWLSRVKRPGGLV